MIDGSSHMEMGTQTQDVRVAYEAATIANKTSARTQEGLDRLNSDKPEDVAILDGLEILAREKLEIEDQSGVDNLTGLANRVGLDRGLSRIISELNRTPAEQRPSLLVLKMDIRLFKVFNDVFNWNIGDEVLKEYGNNFKEGYDGHKFRKYDLLARLGGDDFVMVLKISDMEAAEAIMKKLMDIGTEMSQTLKEQFNNEFIEQVNQNPNKVVRAVRLPEGSDLSTLNWDKLGVGGLTIAGIPFSLNDEELERITKMPIDEIWQNVFSNKTDKVYAKAKEVESKATTGILHYPDGVDRNLGQVELTQ